MVLPVEAMALARRVLPVPGGPNIRTPRQARRMPVKYCGIFRGRSTAYCRRDLAVSRSAIS